MQRMSGMVKGGIVIVAIALIGLMTVGCSSGENTYRQYKEMEAIVHQGDLVYKRYKTADNSTARSALLNYIGNLEALLSNGHPEKFAFGMDITISYVRLAKLEEIESGRDKELYMQKAEEQCKRLNQQNCTSHKLREIVDMMDQAAPKQGL